MVEPGPVRLQQDPDNSEPQDKTDEPGLPEALPTDSLDINVEGRELAPTQSGFGKLWRKHVTVPLTGVDITPAEVIQVWRNRFGEFWPEGSRFYRPLTGLHPGEVALADIEMIAGSRLSTGIVVTQAGPTSFTFITPKGHTFAGQITFSAYEEAGTTIASVEVLMRASDPLFEIGMPIGGHQRENTFWKQTLSSLAAHFGVNESPRLEAMCLDPRRRWRNAGNIVYNSGIHTALYLISRPFRMLFGRLSARNTQT